MNTTWLKRESRDTVADLNGQRVLWPCESFSDFCILGWFCCWREKCVISSFHTSSWFPVSVFMCALREEGKAEGVVWDFHVGSVMTTTWLLLWVLHFSTNPWPSEMKFPLPSGGEDPLLSRLFLSNCVRPALTLRRATLAKNSSNAAHLLPPLQNETMTIKWFSFGEKGLFPCLFVQSFWVLLNWRRAVTLFQRRVPRECTASMG